MPLIAIYNDIEKKVCYEEDLEFYKERGYVLFRKIFLENADKSEVIYKIQANKINNNHVLLQLLFCVLHVLYCIFLRKPLQKMK